MALAHPLHAALANLANEVERATQVGYDQRATIAPAQALQGLSGEELKRCMPDSILLLTNGTLAMVPHTRAVTKPGGDPSEARINVWTRLAGPGSEKDYAWMRDNVEEVILGALTTGTTAGPKAHLVTLSGAKAIIRMGDGDAPKTLKVSVGSTEIPMSFYEAQAALEGLDVRQWTEVVVEPPLVSEHGLPSLNTARTITVPQVVVSGGQNVLLNIRTGALATLGLLDDTGADPTCQQVAQYICEMVEKPGATSAVTLCLSVLALVVMGVTPAAQSHHTSATSTAGQGICSALGVLVDELTRSPVLLAAGSRVEGLQLAGFANLVACGQAVGASIKEMRVEPHAEQANQVPPQVQTLLPPQQIPAAQLSPELQRIAELETLLSRAHAAAAQVQSGPQAPPPHRNPGDSTHRQPGGLRHGTSAGILWHHA